MKFMDKVKAQAAQAAEKAQEGIRAGKVKLEEAQAKKKAEPSAAEPATGVNPAAEGAAPSPDGGGDFTLDGL